MLRIYLFLSTQICSWGHSGRTNSTPAKRTVISWYSANEPHRPNAIRCVPGCAGPRAGGAGWEGAVDVITATVLLWTLGVLVWALAEYVEGLPKRAKFKKK